MFDWLKRWRKHDELRGLSAEERRAIWEERDRVERAFLDKLEKKLADALPEAKTEEPAQPPPRSARPPAAPPRERERVDPPMERETMDRSKAPREPYFGEIERFPRLVRSRPAAAEPRPVANEEEEIPHRPAERYEKIATELRSAKLERHAASPPPAEEPRVDPEAAHLGLVLRAAVFAAERHKNQRLKAAARDPYINHLLEVAALLADATDGQDPELVIAGLLRDAVDDQTGTAEITRQFGESVAGLVAEVAEEKDAAGGERRPIDLATIGTKSPRAQMIKIAELTSRVRALRQSPPPDWPAERRHEYMQWAKQVVASCRGASERLAIAFDEACGIQEGPRRQAH
jgi:GTP diphosphokinase / guanosine-3',5'-bis(diphosphate) 3'-diphosphatase